MVLDVSVRELIFVASLPCRVKAVYAYSLEAFLATPLASECANTAFPLTRPNGPFSGDMLRKAVAFSAWFILNASAEDVERYGLFCLCVHRAVAPEDAVFMTPPAARVSLNAAPRAYHSGTGGPQTKGRGAAGAVTRSRHRPRFVHHRAARAPRICVSAPRGAAAG